MVLYNFLLFCTVVAVFVAPLSCDNKSSAVGDTETQDSVDVATDSGSSGGTDSSNSTEIDSDTNSDFDSTESDSATETVPEPVTNEWVFIEGGTFEMGTANENIDYARPVHEVTIDSFEILKTEVTTHQYRECVNDGVCTPPDSTEGTSCQLLKPTYITMNNSLIPSRVNYPVNCVNQRQAEEYCVWLGGRLLSEAEWEYAARSGGQPIGYPWGDEIATCERAVIMQGDFPGCGEGDSLPVCSKPLGNTAQGLCDMAGNLIERVADRVRLTDGYNGAPTDGSAWLQDSIYAVLRGGGSTSNAYGVHVAARLSQDVASGSNAQNTIRCAR